MEFHPTMARMHSRAWAFVRPQLDNELGPMIAGVSSLGWRQTHVVLHCQSWLGARYLHAAQITAHVGAAACPRRRRWC
jgi:hypothetical protein